MAVTCPTCNASAWESCVNPDTRQLVPAVHPRRRQEAESLARQEAKRRRSTRRPGHR